MHEMEFVVVVVLDHGEAELAARASSRIRRSGFINTVVGNW